MAVMRGLAARLSDTRPPTSLGAPVMALGIFGAAALPHLPGGAALVAPLAAALVIVWAVLAAALVASLRRGGVARHTRPLVGSFAIGTWIAATVVVTRMVMLARPDWPEAGLVLFGLAAALWLWFMPLALSNLMRLAVTPRVRPSGVILLATVATQAVALSALRLFPHHSHVHAAASAVLALGAACYLVGVVLVVMRLGGGGWQLERDWDNTNCIIHGALSITGLAVVVGDLLPRAGVLALWTCVVALVVIVEADELARLVVRVRRLGWRDAALVYHPSQWARNFTVGMFYAFTAAFAERFAIGPAHASLAALRDGVLAVGPYVVLALLLVELGLFAGARRA